MTSERPPREEASAEVAARRTQRERSTSVWAYAAIHVSGRVPEGGFFAKAMTGKVRPNVEAA